MKKYRIAIYMRLSKEDGSKKEESNSISMQRMMLQSYVEEHFSDYSLLEFADDGYTGTNFSRPGVQKMLEGVKNSAIDCIVVKDFSRFARDYIELGSYLEQIFPFMGVRFISVNDHYDSEDHKENAGELDVNFKNLLYDLYSKDLSQKVKTSLAARKAKGQYVSGNCPFGYDKAPDDRHMLVIAEDEAEIVRRMFELALEGYTSTQIAKLFNEEKVKTPIEFKMEKGKTTRTAKGNVFLWSNSFICQALRNPIYAGDIVYGKYEKDFVGGKNHIKPRGQWKIFRNHHEPIIDREIFEQVQAARGRGRQTPNRESHVLVGKAVCGCCGRNLGYRLSRNPYFYCNGRYSNALDHCVKRIDASVLEQHVFDLLLEKLDREGELEKLAQEDAAELCRALKESKNKLRMLIDEQSKHRKENFEEYQRFAEGRSDTFHSRETAIQSSGKAIEAQRMEIGRLEEAYEKASGCLREESGGLSKRMIDRYVKRIVVFEGQIKMEWLTV